MAQMDDEKLLRIIAVLRGALDEAEAIVREDSVAQPPLNNDNEEESVMAMATATRNDQWKIDDVDLNGGWDHDNDQQGVTYGWPDGNIDHYDRFSTYNGTGALAGLTLALGFLPNGDVVGFVLSANGGPERGLTYFFETDDFATTNEKVSMIRGGGPRGRSGFSPADALPKAYGGFEIDILKDRKAGKWNRTAVVADADDYETMLNHTAIQAKLRGLA